ncbi:MAG: DUF368 domain-containing protein [Clostridia bacterium]|nr:DUF368 domain-containing protein [Clostridia bacterium]
MELKYKNAKEILMSLFVGVFIGLSVIVPGISGSTIAIIMKVYDKLMYSFANIFKRFKACFIFLLPILAGIVVGFGAGFVLVKLLIEKFPFITICFFVGLMIGTFPLLFKEIKGEKVTKKRSILFSLGVIVPIAITVISLFISTNNTLLDIQPWHYILFLFIGILISITQLIPGLSATVLLMIFGYYTTLISGIDRELFSNVKLIFIYVTLVVGFVLGTLIFSKGINKLLNTQKIPFYFVICGLSVSSVISVFLGSDCVSIYKSWIYVEGMSSTMIKDIVIGVVFLAVGLFATLSIYFIDKKMKQKNK